VRTFFAVGSAASLFACSNLLSSFLRRFSFFVFRETSSRLILFLIEEGSNREEGMSAQGRITSSGWFE
jgi:hypothetical protein